MITTAGNGPGPSGFKSSAGISSKAPLVVVVVIDRPEDVVMQPERNTKDRISSISLVIIIPREDLTFQ
jgi:hypothetical protein